MCNNSVNFVLYVFVLCKNFSLLCLFYNIVYKFKTLSVSGFYCRLVLQVNIRLHIRCLLLFLSAQPQHGQLL